MPTRRQALRGASTAGATATLATIPASGPARAAHDDAQPSHVTLSYDQALLDRYRPRLVMDQEARDRLLGLYGWYATSPEFETDVAVYWASYSHQTGVTSFDSHWGDHEPCYTVIDSTTGEIREVVASIYHWLRGRTTSIATDGDHPLLRVISPWHHYTAADHQGALFDVKDLTAVFDEWLANGMHADLEPGLARNPWLMAGETGRGHWWATSRIGPVDLGVSTTRYKVEAYRALGAGVEGHL